MRVAHVATVPKSFIFLRDQVPFMRARGVEVEAIASAGPEMEQFAREHQIVTHALPMTRAIDPLDDLRVVFALARLLRQRAPDIVHAHTPKGGLLGMLGATLAGIDARVYHMRGLLTLTATGWRRALFTWTERLCCALASEVICVSDSLRRAAIAQRLAPASKLHVMAGGSGQGVDAARRFNPAHLEEGVGAQTRQLHDIPKDAVVFGFVGRLVGDKGVRELMEAWRHVRELIPRAWLLVVGDFEERDALGATIRRAMERDARVVRLGWRDDVASCYAAMDVVVLPSYREGFPNVPLEAAAMELPVITTDATGCVDSVVAGETGVVVPVRDAEALAEAMVGYAREPELRRAHGLRGRERALVAFAPERIFEEIYTMYVALLDR